VNANTRVYVMTVNNANEVSINECSSDSDYAAILEWLKINGGCNEHRIGFLFRNEALNIYGKNVPTERVKVTATEKYGDILIDGVPLVFD
jgi:hypothetical protein